MNAGLTQSVFVAKPRNIARYAIQALLRHRVLFAGVAGAILFLTLLVTIATPASFQSEMHLLVRGPGQILQPETMEATVSYEIDLLRSKDLADVVVDPDWSKTPLARRSEEDIRQHEASVVDFTNHLTVEPLDKSNIIRIAYVASGPREATETLDRLLQAFLAKRREIEHSSAASSLLATEAERYRQELDGAQQRLAAYQQENQAAELAMKRKHPRPQPATKVSTIELTALQSRVQEIENSYEFYKQKASEARIADAMNEDRGHVAVAERPTFSTRPHRPQIFVNFAMGMVTALLFAFTAVFIADARDAVAIPAVLGAISSADVPATVPLHAEVKPGSAMGGRSPRAPTRLTATNDQPIPESSAFTDGLRPPMTYGALALSPTFAEDEDAEYPILTLQAPERATAPAMQPEIPVPSMAEAQPGSVAAAPQPAFAIQPGDPCHRRLHRPLSDPSVPARSNLSPSQRAQVRRPASPRESDDQAPYVTYTVDPKP